MYNTWSNRVRYMIWNIKFFICCNKVIFVQSCTFCCNLLVTDIYIHNILWIPHLSSSPNLFGNFREMCVVKQRLTAYSENPFIHQNYVFYPTIVHLIKQIHTLESIQLIYLTCSSVIIYIHISKQIIVVD